MAFMIVLVMVAVVTAQFAAGLPANFQSKLEERITRTKRHTPNEAAANISAGLAYTQTMLLGCYEPTLLPQVSSVSKHNCNSINDVYISLMRALDKVLGLYEFQERLKQDQNSTVETRALQIVIDTVVNQTCQWIESLDMHYSSDSHEALSCYSSGPDPMAHIKKLHSLVSAYQLVNDVRVSLRKLEFNNISSDVWLKTSGVQPALNQLLTGTDYDIHLSRGPCLVTCS